ncbi:MAG: TolC family outer membrane protein [Pseudorhodobacter sp.]|nr:TolC family outer membrane protein [Pseudorhodobacter sp.]
MGRIGNTLAVLAALVVWAAAPLAQAETLSDALIAAYRNSNLLDQNRALLRAADEDVASAVADLRPVINFALQSTYRNAEVTNFPLPNFTTDSLDTAANLSFELTLFDFGRNALAVEAAKETVLATREALINVEQLVLLAAVQSFVQTRLAQEIVALRESNVRVITQELRAARDRFEVGEITRTDVAVAESRLAAARSDLAAAEGDLLVAREAYKAATGAYPGNLAPPPRAPGMPKTLDEAQAVALRSHPILRQTQHQVTVADLNVERAAAAMKPTLTAQAVLGMQQGGLENESVTLSLNQTLYVGGKLSAIYRQALAGRDATRAGLHQTAVTVAQNVGNAWSNLLVSSASINATNLQIAAAQTAYDGMREEAKVGSRTTLDVLDAEQELLNAKAAKLSAEATRYFGVYVLLQTMGLLTVEHLGLGIPTYDVSAYYNAVKGAPATSSQGRKLDRVLQAIGGGN